MTGKSRDAGGWQLGARCIEKVERKCSNTCPIPLAPAPSCNTSHPLSLTVQPNAISNPTLGLKRASEVMDLPRWPRKGAGLSNCSPGAGTRRENFPANGR